jgi:hypothetical protein
MAASFTSFDKVVKPNQNSKSCAPPTSNCHSSDVDDTFLVSTTHTACENVGEAAKAEHAKASQCALLAKDQLFGCIKELFSPEHEQERSVIVQNAVQDTLVSIQTGLGSCHDQVDAVLITVFDQPVDEVQMRDSMDHSESVSFNEDLTVDSALQSTQDDRVPQSSRRVRSMATSGNKVVPQIGRTADESDEEPSSEMNLKRVSTTESEAASLLRFKEELYKSLDAKLDEVLSDNFEEPSLPSPPSLDEDADAPSDPPSRQDNSEKHDVEDDHRVDIEEELDEGAPVEDDDGVHEPTEEHNYRTVEIRDAVVDELEANAFQQSEVQVTTPHDFQETRMEEQDSDARYEFSSPSMEEFDRLLRTDIEKLDHVGERRRNVAKSNVPMKQPNADSTANVVLPKADPLATLPSPQNSEFTSLPVQQVRASPVPSALLRTETPTICLEDVVNGDMSSSSTPLRDNRANEEEPEIVDLVHYKPGPRWLYNQPSADLSTRQQSFRYKYEEEVIDLTMYDEGF